MTTIEQDWLLFKNHVYPGKTDDTTEQMRQLKACWFSAYLGCLSLMRVIGAESTDEDHGVELLECVHKEAQDFIVEHTKEEFKRQGIKLKKEDML